MATSILDMPTRQLDEKEPDARDFGDFDATRQLTYDNVLNAARSFQPVTNQRYRLELNDVDYEGPDAFTLADQKRAILEGRSLGRRLRGTWRLFDADGDRVVDEKRVTLANVPWLSPRGTYVFNGNDYGLAHQARLRPGIFARIKDSGELESHINVSRGLGHRYFLDPETGVFRVQIGQARIPIVPLLQALGTSERELRQAWGNELFESNMKASKGGALKKIYQRIYKGRPVPEDAQSINQAILAAFEEMELDPEVTQQTLGEAHTKMGPQAILSSLNKLLRVHKGEADPDDRDSMAYQRLLGPEDLFADRIRKARGEVGRALWKATFKGNLSKLQPGLLDRSVQGTLLDTGLGNPLEEINPAELLDQSHRVTRMGEGGIPSNEAVPDEARNVQPSHMGFIDPAHTPESGKIGVDGRIAYQTRKGKDGRIYSRFTDAHTGKTVWRSPQDIADKVVAFPQDWRRGEDFVRAIDNGRMRYVPRNKVDYALSDMTESFGPLASMVPIKADSAAQRVSMGARMMTQAVPLVKPEAPFVQSGIPGEDKSFEEHYGTYMGARRSDVDGKVVAVSPGEIKIQGRDRRIHRVELYDHFPYNRKTFIHNTPTVEVGQRIGKGDLLARSNFTSPEGVTALGLNARVAYIPWKGKNFEDAIVVSRSFANRATSEHAYQNDLDLDDDTKASRQAFTAIFPSKYKRQVLDQFDDNGVIKPGTRVQHNDPLILAVHKKQVGPRLGRRRQSYVDASVTWDHHSSGVVTDVVRTNKGINVVVKSTAPLQQGDKLAGRYGDKGVVAEVVPDDRMPRGQDGKPFEVLLNPEGIISRGNPAQAIETALGKIVERTGKPYKMPDFDDRDDIEAWAEQELRKHKLEAEETIHDPEDNRDVPNVLTGNRFIMKLHHTAETKLQGRDIGGYSAEDTPAKGGKEGAKRVGMLELNALLSHGAYDVIRDASLIRGQKNEDLWRMVMSGYTPTSPGVPYTYRKFYHQLQAAGINPIKSGTKTQLMAMTGKDIDRLAENRELKNVDTVDWRVSKLTPKKGGLFDEGLTGGHGGERWSYIKLHTPMPNPVMEEPIRRMLGLTKPKLMAVLSGKEKLDGATGPQAITDALDKIDVQKAMEQARAQIKGGRKTHRDAAIRRLQYLKGVEKTGIHPREWVLDKVPVLPPAFRPVSLMGKTATPLVADPNYLYKEVWDANDALKGLEGQIDDVSQERLNLYNAFKGIVGLGDPIQPKHQEQQVKGILKSVFGSSPKFGVVQRKLLGSTVDLVGRGTITPNPDLDMDQVGLPVNQAWTLYRPFVVRRLVRRGMPRLRALRAVEDREPVAEKELMEELQRRPVIVNRAPTLHKYGVMAFYPRLTQADTIEVPPLVVGGFGADFDGDAVQLHVPADDRAADNAKERMLPSKNLLSAGNFRAHYMPSQEYIAGLYEASTRVDKKKPKLVFRSVKDAMKAYRTGRVELGQQIEILEN